MPVTTIAQVQQAIQGLPSLAALKPEEYAELDGWADVVVKDVGKDLKATQLRKIFHYIKDLQREFEKTESNFSRAKVALIMPSLAYAVGRKHIPENFYNLLTLCFGQQKCRDAKDFESAVSFLEAIMAYHKYHNPKEA